MELSLFFLLLFIEKNETLQNSPLMWPSYLIKYHSHPSNCKEENSCSHLWIFFLPHTMFGLSEIHLSSIFNIQVFNSSHSFISWMHFRLAFAITILPKTAFFKDLFPRAILCVCACVCVFMWNFSLGVQFITSFSWLSSNLTYSFFFLGDSFSNV